MRISVASYISIVTTFIWFAFDPSAMCSAQSDRYELGKRVRRFEVAWQTADPALRKASTAPLQKAVQNFFSLQFANAGQQLDNAYFAVRQVSPPTPFEQLAIAQRLLIESVTLDTQAAVIRLKIKPFYETSLNASNTLSVISLDDAALQIRLLDGSGSSCGEWKIPFSEASVGNDLKLADVPVGDYWISATIELDTEQVSLPSIQVSIVQELHGRVSKLENWLKEQTQTAIRTDENETVRLTVKQYVQTLKSQIDQRELETDFPAAQLLQLGEQLVAEPSRASELWRNQSYDSVWLTLSHNRKSLPVRVHIPEINRVKQNANQAQASAERLPILFAFHGAGGSENMFFEAYGAGRLVDLAAERGFIVVAPRHPLLGVPLNYRQMIEVLELFFPIDHERVFLIGHSMGAAEVVRQVSLHTSPPRAAIALGGGGNVKNAPAVVSTPWLVAAGEFDFGRSGAKSLVKQLEHAGSRVDYREYQDVEHLVIVQAALDDVFSFIDQR